MFDKSPIIFRRSDRNAQTIIQTRLRKIANKNFSLLQIAEKIKGFLARRTPDKNEIRARRKNKKTQRLKLAFQLFPASPDGLDVVRKIFLIRKRRDPDILSQHIDIIRIFDF